MKKPVLISLFNQKCPRCREGKFFKYSALHIRFDEHLESCSHCGLKYEGEPGFFQGSLYINYAINVAMIITLFTALKLTFDPALHIYYIIIIGFILSLMTFIYRFAKICFMYLFSGVKYDEKLSS